MTKLKEIQARIIKENGYDTDERNGVKRKFSNDCEISLDKYNGVPLDAMTIGRLENNYLTLEEILAHENVEAQQVLLKEFTEKNIEKAGEKIFEELGGKLINTHEGTGYELFSVTVAGNDLKMVRYSCPSTERVYTKIVEEHWECPIAALAHHHGYENAEAYLADERQS